MEHFGDRSPCLLACNLATYHDPSGWPNTCERISLAHCLLPKSEPMQGALRIKSRSPMSWIQAFATCVGAQACTTYCVNTYMHTNMHTYIHTPNRLPTYVHKPMNTFIHPSNACTASHFTQQHYFTFHHITLHRLATHIITTLNITLHYTTLQNITLPYSTIYYNTLNHTTWKLITLLYIKLQYATLRRVAIPLHHISLSYHTTLHILTWYDIIRSYVLSCHCIL